MNADFHSLIEKHLNASLTAAEAATLAQAMAENPALAEEFAAATRMDADLAAAAKDVGRTGLYTRRMERAAVESEPVRRGRRLPLRTMSAAAGLAVLCGAGWRILEGSGRPGPFAQKGKSGSSGERSSGDGVIAALAGKIPAMDSAAMKKMLRRFFVPAMNVRQQPVSSALASLQQEWKDNSSEDSKEAAVTFTVADSVRQRWPKPEDEPLVSLEIPGISLLTNLELLAAQAGLKAVVTSSGASLEEDPRAADEKERTWNIPLPKASLIAFMNKASATFAAGQSQVVHNTFMMESSSWGGTGDNRFSWMAPPQEGFAVVDSGLQQPVRWDDLGLSYLWNPTGTSGAPVAQSWSEASGQPVGAGELLANIVSEEQRAAYLTDLESLATTQTLSYELASRAQFSPDGKQIVIVGTDETAKIWDVATGQPVAPPQSYTDYDGDGTIDLNLTYSEVAGLEGFINYGTPIETTGINALGEGEPVVLTDSGITQPVFAAVRRSYPENLTRLLAVHGLPAAGASWDPETGVLTAKGTMQSLRAAHAAAAAIDESASAGISVDMRVIAWKDGQSPPGTDPDMILPPARAAAVLTAKDADALIRLPNASVSSAPRVRAAVGAPVSLHQDSVVQVPRNGNAPNAFRVETKVELNPVKRFAGDTFLVPVKMEHTRTATLEGELTPVGTSQTDNIPYKVHDGAWLQFNFPAEGGAHATTVLLHIQSATLHPE